MTKLSENEEVMALANELSARYKANKLILEEELALLDMSEGVAISLYLADRPLPITLLESLRYLTSFKTIVEFSDRIVKGEFDV